MAEKRNPSVPGLIHTYKRSKLNGLENMAVSGIQRTSSLSAPVVQLEDHQGIINSCKFHPCGELVMSAGFDKKIHIRCVYGPQGAVMIMEGHTSTVTEAQFSPDGNKVYSSSLDKTVAVWDTKTGSQIELLEGHNCIVNTVHTSSNNLVCSGSDDRTMRLWDIREPSVSQVFESGHPVLAACFNQTGDHIITGGTDNDIKIWDIRRNEVVCILRGHIDMISGLALSPCGTHLLSNSLDNTVRLWDVRPFALGNRCVDVYTAHNYMAECNLLRCAWSKDGRRIAFGASDTHVYIWNPVSHQMVYRLEGHDASVIDVDFHPHEPIIVSGSSDENLLMYELQK